MVVLKPIGIEYQNDILYFTAKVNTNQEMLFIVDIQTGNLTHSEPVDYFGSKILEVSEDGKYVFVTLTEEVETDVEPVLKDFVVIFDVEKLTFTKYIENACDLQFSPDYKYTMYMCTERDVEQEGKAHYITYYSESIIVKNTETDEVIYELNPGITYAISYRFSADGKGIFCMKVEFRSVITGSQGRYVGIYIDLTKGTKKKLFTGKWGEELGEVIIIGNFN